MDNTRTVEYQGAFRLPNTPMGASNFGYAGTFTFNPRNNSIVGIGHDHHQMVAEYLIPEINQSATLAAWRSWFLQNDTTNASGRIS